MSNSKEFVIEREFVAPRALVWRLWTEPDLVSEWYGPNIETIFHKFDLKVGGEWHDEMRMGENSMFGKVIFQEIIEPEKLVWLHSSADKDGNIIDNPMMPDWPRTLLTTVTFEEAGDRTKLRLSWIPYEASEAEIEAFNAMADRMGGGWGAGFDIIENMLERMQS